MEFKNKTIGQKIRIVRKKMKLTQSELGEYIGMDRDAISRMERNKQIVKATDLFAIAGTLGINIYDFNKWN